jgi:hypothetical protein
MNTYENIATAVRNLTPYAIANMDQARMDNDEARAYYEQIRDDYAQAIEDEEGKPDEERTQEIADGAPDVYNYTRMQEAIGTGAYLDESEIASGGESMIQLAGYVLYEQAQRILYRLDELYTELDDAEPDED